MSFADEDASRAGPEFLIRLFGEGIAAGARTINLADTVDMPSPKNSARSSARCGSEHPEQKSLASGACTADDLGLGVANTLAEFEPGHGRWTSPSAASASARAMPRLREW